MWKFFFWSIFWLPAFHAIWQLLQDVPMLSPLANGLILLATGVLSGLRIGTDSAIRYSKDLFRMNKFLAEMNSDLANQNHELLKSMLISEEEKNDS